MSHATAALRFADGSYWFAEYDGTSDQILDAIYPTKDMLRLAWRGDALRDRACTCGATPEQADYAEDYGDGSWGPVTACRACEVIVDKSAFHVDSEYADGPNPGHPTWWKDATAPAISLELPPDTLRVLSDLAETHGMHAIATRLRNCIKAEKPA